MNLRSGTRNNEPPANNEPTALNESPTVNPNMPLDQPQNTGQDGGQDEDVFHNARTTFFGPQHMRIPLPKMPQFNKDNPGKWFQRLRVQLELIGAKTEADKYRGLLSYLDEEQLMAITDWISQLEENGPVVAPFTQAKERLTTLHEQSLVSRLRNLMNIKPQDGLPSQYLRSLILEAGANPDMNLIGEIWEDNLPAYMSTIIHSDPELSLEAVAAKLDKMHKATARKAEPFQPAVAATVNNIAVVDHLTERLARMEQLLMDGEVFAAERPRQSRQQQQQQYAQPQHYAQPQQYTQQQQYAQQHRQPYMQPQQQHRQPYVRPQQQQTRYNKRQQYQQDPQQYAPMPRQQGNYNRSTDEHAPCYNCRRHGVNVRNCTCAKNG